MLYKYFVLFLNNSFFRRALRKIGKVITGIDFISDNFDNTVLVKKYSKGKTFVDIGALWGIHGLNTFVAEESGALRSIAVDVYSETPEFLETVRKKNSRVEFIRGDINNEETIKKIGFCDVVLCSGVVYHTPSPIDMFMRLRMITKETLILNTASIPEFFGVKNVAVFYPFLSKEQRNIWNRGIGSQKAITGPYEPQEGYANWFWGMTPSAIESMLLLAGFEVTERFVYNFRTVFVCKTTSVKFTPSSGEWTTPKDPEYEKFRRPQ